VRVLFLSGWYPYPPNNGSKLRIYNLLSGLAYEHEVTLVSFADEGDRGVDTKLTQICRRVRVVPWKPFNPRSLRSMLGFFSLSPRSVIDTYSPEMARRIREECAAQRYDLVIASQITTAAYVPLLPPIPALFEEVELGARYEKFAAANSFLHRIRHRLTWMKFHRYLGHLLGHFRACTVVSEEEKRLLAAVVPRFKTIEVVPNCVHVSEYRGFQAPAKPNTLVFTGSFSYFPNYEAMVWFLRDVYPHVQKEIPGVEVTITGDHGNRPLPGVGNLKLTGLVEDARPLVARSWASIVPLQHGGGTRLKILEAMALGTPVVSTSKGAEGLGLRHGEHALIADGADDFARAVVRLLKDPGLRAHLSRNAYELVVKKYDWTAVMPRFLTLLAELSSAKTPSASLVEARPGAVI